MIPVSTGNPSMHRRRFLIAAFSATGAALNARAAQTKHFDIVYPQIRPGGDVHAAFALAVLDLAMRSANADYTIRQAKVVMERGRALAELANDDTINLHWTSMDAQAEQGLSGAHSNSPRPDWLQGVHHKKGPAAGFQQDPKPG